MALSLTLTHSRQENNPKNKLAFAFGFVLDFACRLRLTFLEAWKMQLDKQQAEEKYPTIIFEGEQFHIEKNLYIGDNVRMEKDVYICQGAHIGNDVRILSKTYIDQGAYIGQGVCLGDGGGEDSQWQVDIRKQAYVGKGVAIGCCTKIGTGSWVEQNAIIGAHVSVGERAYIGADAIIGADSVISHGAGIAPKAIIPGKARIACNRSRVRNALVILRDTLALYGAGETADLTAHDSDDGLIIVMGSWPYKGKPIEGARIAVKEKYPKKHPYFKALDLAQSWYDNLETWK